jgi:predicted metal-dependent phosphoesterase TrpH
MYDLHVHSTASDGKLTPRELVKAAVEIGLTGFALTDHDTVDGLNEAAAYIRENNIPLDFIPGIELNTDYKGQEYI